MRPLDINLSSRPYRNDLPIALLLGVLAIAAFALTGYNAYTYVTADSRLDQMQRELADHQGRMEQFRAEAEQLEAELAQIDLEVLEPQAEFANAVLQERNFSWTLFFNALEDVLPWHTKLSSIRPRFEAGRVMIDLNATSQNYDSFLDFQRVLQLSPFFDQVVPTGFETGKGGDLRVYFTLEMAYDPSAAAPTTEALPGEGGQVAAVETIVVGEEGDAAPVSAAAGRAESGLQGPPQIAPADEPELAAASTAASPPAAGAQSPGTGRAGTGADKPRKRRGGAGRKAGRRPKPGIQPGQRPTTVPRGVVPLGSAPAGAGGPRGVVEPDLLSRDGGDGAADGASGARPAPGAADGALPPGAERRQLSEAEQQALREQQTTTVGGKMMIKPKIKEGKKITLPQSVLDQLPPDHPARRESERQTGGSAADRGSRGGSDGSAGSGGDGSAGGGGSGSSGSGGAGSGSSSGGGGAP